MARLFTAASSMGLTNAAAIVAAYPFTFATWARSSSNTLHQCLMSLADNAGTNDYVALTLDGSAGGDPLKLLQLTGGSAASISASSFTANVDLHVGGVFTSATARELYKDGVSVGTNTTSLAMPSNLDSTDLGYRKLSTPDLFHNGLLWETAIYSVALSVDDMAALGKGYSPRMVRPGSLVAYWPLPGSGSSERDRWKNGHNLTLVNAPVKGENGRRLVAA